MKHVLSVLFLFALGVMPVSCVGPSSRLASVSLRLNGPADVSLDENSASWSAALTNVGAGAADLVLPGDGSESGMRTPLVGWSVIPTGDVREHPREMPVAEMARCGNINAIRSPGVVSLAPGETLDLGPWIGQPLFPGPGKYTVAFYYENRPDLPVTGIPLGVHDAGALSGIRRSAPCSARSNEVVVVVRQ